MPTTVVFRGTRDDLRRLIETVPALLAGRVPDPDGVARMLGFRVSNALLSQIQQDYVVKARGGTDRAGIKWAPLAASTVRKRLAKERRKARRGKKRKGKAPPPFAGQVEIGRDTGRQLRALAAGVEDRPAANPDQALKLGPGELIIGTNLAYTKFFHEGTRRQPARPIVPPSGELPLAYVDPLMAAASRGVVAVIQYLIDRGYRG